MTYCPGWKRAETKAQLAYSRIIPRNEPQTAASAANLNGRGEIRPLNEAAVEAALLLAVGIRQVYGGDAFTYDVQGHFDPALLARCNSVFIWPEEEKRFSSGKTYGEYSNSYASFLISKARKEDPTITDEQAEAWYEVMKFSCGRERRVSLLKFMGDDGDRAEGDSPGNGKEPPYLLCTNPRITHKTEWMFDVEMAIERKGAECAYEAAALDWQCIEWSREIKRLKNYRDRDGRLKMSDGERALRKERHDARIRRNRIMRSDEYEGAIYRLGFGLGWCASGDVTFLGPIRRAAARWGINVGDCFEQPTIVGSQGKEGE